MIRVTRLDGKELIVNADQILTVESTPDTVLLFTTGLHLMVRELPDEIVARVVEYRRWIAGPERRGELVAFPGASPQGEG